MCKVKVVHGVKVVVFYVDFLRLGLVLVVILYNMMLCNSISDDSDLLMEYLLFDLFFIVFFFSMWIL